MGEIRPLRTCAPAITSRILGVLDMSASQSEPKCHYYFFTCEIRTVQRRWACHLGGEGNSCTPVCVSKRAKVLLVYILSSYSCAHNKMCVDIETYGFEQPQIFQTRCNLQLTTYIDEHMHACNAESYRAGSHLNLTSRSKPSILQTYSRQHKPDHKRKQG
jgi:hypothetical protein